MQLPYNSPGDFWSTSYFPSVSIFLLTALGGLPENPGATFNFAMGAILHKYATGCERVCYERDLIKTELVCCQK